MPSKIATNAADQNDCDNDDDGKLILHVDINMM